MFEGTIQEFAWRLRITTETQTPIKVTSNLIEIRKRYRYIRSLDSSKFLYHICCFNSSFNVILGNTENNTDLCSLSSFKLVKVECFSSDILECFPPREGNTPFGTAYRGNH
jgi:hypothetical protein